MQFGVGITVLRQYEEIIRCLRSVRASSLLPVSITIIDNGRDLFSLVPPLKSVLSDVLVITPGHNLGVAASWNLLLKLIHPLPAIILNDDCEVDKDTFRRMMEVPGPALVNGLGWACFRQDEYITKIVGRYDEQFWPAYYEDADFAQRMRLLAIRPVDLGNIINRHGNHGEHPYQHFTPAEMDAFELQVEENKTRFLRKWGALPSELEKEWNHATA